MKFVSVLLLIALVSCSSREDKEKKLSEVSRSKTEAIAEMHSAKFPAISGIVTLEESEDGLIVSTDLKGLKPGARLGFHIHQEGICEGPDYKTAGDHYNPSGSRHGHPSSTEKHSGDMGNLTTNENGESKNTILISGTKLSEVMGKAILIHSDPDDFKTQPSGNSGARIACGLIRSIE